MGVCQCRLGSAAPPHLSLTHYTELKESKGIVLVRGDALSPHIVSVPEVIPYTACCQPQGSRFLCAAVLTSAVASTGDRKIEV